MHQVVAILADFVDVISDVLRDRPTPFDACRPIDQATRTDSVVGVPIDVTTIRTSAVSNSGHIRIMYVDSTFSAAVTRSRGDVLSGRSGVAGLNGLLVVVDCGGNHVTLPHRALDAIDKTLGVQPLAAIPSRISRIDCSE